jgi:hypothetical protein
MSIRRLFIWVLFTIVALQACKQQKKIYASECAVGIKFKKVSFENLVDSIQYYNKQYVQVSGKYVEEKNVSALVSDSTFTGHGTGRSFWVNFTQECPLYLKGKHTGLFETEDGEYKQINNRLMTIRGRLDVSKKGHLGTYRATINEVSYLELY